MINISLIIFSYLLGSIPTGLLIAKMRGVDLRAVGSKNIGATNVLRAVGKTEALFTLLGDMLKGVAAVLIGRYTGVDGFLCGLAAILGHDFSIFLRLKGGKGVATSLGVVLAAYPVVGVICAAAWLLTASITKYSSFSALMAFTTLPFIVYFIKGGSTDFIISIIITALIYCKHRQNIVRLLRGEESKIGKMGD